MSKRPPLLPRPPEIKTSADFVVAVFVVLVATILTLLTLAVMLSAVFGGSEVTVYFTTLTDIMTTVIGALVGYLAGKGSVRMEQEQLERELKRTREHLEKLQ